MDVKTCQLDGVRLITPPPSSRTSGATTRGDLQRDAVHRRGRGHALRPGRHLHLQQGGPARDPRRPEDLEADLLPLRLVLPGGAEPRRELAQFGRWQGFTLSDRNRLQVLVPPRFGNGHLVLTDQAIFSYKQTTDYDRASQFTVVWNDPRFQIFWPIRIPSSRPATPASADRSSASSGIPRQVRIGARLGSLSRVSRMHPAGRAQLGCGNFLGRSRIGHRKGGRQGEDRW